MSTSSCSKLLLIFLIVLLSGCGYSVHGKADLPFRAITIMPVENKTLEPKLQDRLNRILTDTFMEYGFDVRPAAPYTLSGSVTDFTLQVLSERDLTASEYAIIIKADFEFRDGDGKAAKLVGVGSPFVTYFSATGKLENVIAEKEVATDRALQDLSEELLRRVLYQAP